jgi:hypothetical protein
MIFRSSEAKADPVLSWNRPERPFFAAGACHVLAAAFLELHPNEAWHTIIIRPEPGFRGGHIVVANDKMVFDYHGYSDEDAFLRRYRAKMGRFFPNWGCTLHRVDGSPVSVEFCAQNKLRKPDQFLHDPFPRAMKYVQRLDARFAKKNGGKPPLP